MCDTETENMKCFIVFWEGNSIHHYFESYEEAEKYLVNNNLGRSARIAKLLANGDSKTTLTKVCCKEGGD